MPSAPLSLAISLWGGAPAPVATPAFSPQGVSFSRDIAIKYALGSVAASAHGVMAFWLKGSAGSAAHETIAANMSLTAKIVAGNYLAGDASAEGTKGANIAIDPAAEGIVRLNLNDSTGGGGAAHSANMSKASPGIVNASWQHWLWVWATDFNSGSKRAALLINGIPVVTGITGETINSLTVALATAPFFINTNEPAAPPVLPGVFDMAQFFFDTPSVMTSIIDASSVVAPSVIAKFYNGGPVDLGADGSTPFGSQPLIFHDGAVATWTTNKGSISNASVSLLGSLTGTKKVYAAPVNPGSTSTAPFQNWFSWDNSGNSSWSDVTRSYALVNNYGNPIAVGTVLVMVVTMQDSAGNDRSPVVTGWTLASKSSQSSGGSTLTVSIYYKVAVSADITAHGADWTNAPTITWAAGSTLMNASYHLFAYEHATGTVVGQVTGHAASGTGYVAPAVTASANSVLVSGARVYDWNFEVFTGFAAGQALRFKSPSGASDAMPYIADEPISSAGSTGGRTFGGSGAAVNPYVGFSFNVQ